MGRLLARLGAAWRSIWTPPAVRELEDAAEADATLPDLPPAPARVEPTSGLDAMRDRLDRIEHRNREMARLYDRRREGER